MAFVMHCVRMQHSTAELYTTGYRYGCTYHHTTVGLVSTVPVSENIFMIRSRNFAVNASTLEAMLLRALYSCTGFEAFECGSIRSGVRLDITMET